MRRKGIIIVFFAAVTILSFFFFNTLQLQAVARNLESEKQTLEKANSELDRNLQDSKNRLQELETKAGSANGTKSPSPGINKTAYLTFDDGPSANTALILDILKRYQVKATFFVIGNTSDKGKELYRRIVAEGHAIGLHGFVHDYAVAYQSADAYMNNLYRMQDLLYHTIGQRPTVSRFLGGSNSGMGAKYGGLGLMKNLTARVRAEGLQYFDWNVSSADASKPLLDAQTIVDSVLTGVKQHNQAVILMHDAPAKTTTVDALPRVIEGLEAQGFVFAELTPSSPVVHFQLK